MKARIGAAGSAAGDPATTATTPLLATGAPIIYRLNADATVASKLDLA